jgi:hypothetical protein
MAGKGMKHSHTVLSYKTCTSCGKNLKLNLVDKSPNASKCWRCYKRKPKTVGS